MVESCGRPLSSFTLFERLSLRVGLSSEESSQECRIMQKWERHGFSEIDGDAGEQNRERLGSLKRCNRIFNLPQLPIHLTFSILFF